LGATASIHVLETLGVGALQQALKTKKVVVIDEIGKMELLSPLFRETVMQASWGQHHPGHHLYNPTPTPTFSKHWPR
jgi:hypothetical protein